MERRASRRQAWERSLGGEVHLREDREQGAQQDRRGVRIRGWEDPAAQGHVRSVAVGWDGSGSEREAAGLASSRAERGARGVKEVTGKLHPKTWCVEGRTACRGV